jgi:hypothetical protein
MIENAERRRRPVSGGDIRELRFQDPLDPVVRHRCSVTPARGRRNGDRHFQSGIWCGTIRPVSTFGETYADDLAQALKADLARSLEDYAAVDVRVDVLPGADQIEVRVTRIQDGVTAVERYRVDEGVYHYKPDGSEPAKHGGWLSELFQEDNTGVVHYGYHGPPLPAIVQHADGHTEVLSAEEAAARFGTGQDKP